MKKMKDITLSDLEKALRMASISAAGFLSTFSPFHYQKI